MSTDSRYDLVVIGSGPAGQKGAIAAAKLGRRVAVLDRREMLDGVCVHTGTIPSKTLREAILALNGFRQRTSYGKDDATKREISILDLAFRVNHVLAREMEVVRDQLQRNRIAVFHGTAKFVDPHTVEVDTADAPVRLEAHNILIACGTRPAQSDMIPLDEGRIIDADQVTAMSELPRDLIVVGGGIIGLEYASMLSALGVKVTVLEERAALLEFVDREVVETLMAHMRSQGAIFRLGERVVSVRVDEQDRVEASLKSGNKVHGSALLYAVGRQANTDTLDLAAAGLEADARGRIPVNERYRTAVAHIYAAGDVIGFPALASTSMEQGRLAGSYMFGAPARSTPDLLPYGIYTIPEISMVGMTEEDLTREAIPYAVGIARYEELARAQIMGDDTGMLKILFDPRTRKPYGFHAIGEGATELIHIGQAVITLGGGIEYFRDTVFNHPNLAEAYKVAALDGLNKL